MAKYFSLLTDIGSAKLANAQVTGVWPDLSEMAVGDGGGVYVVPDQAQLGLVREVFRAPINSLHRDSSNDSWTVAEGLIPETVGGWTVREVGVFDTDGDLFAVGAYPETYKPQLIEGSGRDLYIRMIMEIGNAANGTLKIDPSIVLSTRKYVDDTLEPFVNSAIRMSTVQILTMHRQIKLNDQLVGG